MVFGHIDFMPFIRPHANTVCNTVNELYFHKLIFTSAKGGDHVIAGICLRVAGFSQRQKLSF